MKRQSRLGALKPPADPSSGVSKGHENASRDSKISKDVEQIKKDMQSENENTKKVSEENKEKSLEGARKSSNAQEVKHVSDAQKNVDPDNKAKAYETDQPKTTIEVKKENPQQVSEK